MKPLVLLVEDNHQILKNMEIILKFNDFEVLTALNGEEAIKKLSDSPYLPNCSINNYR